LIGTLSVVGMSSPLLLLLDERSTPLSSLDERSTPLSSRVWKSDLLPDLLFGLVGALPTLAHPR